MIEVSKKNMFSYFAQPQRLESHIFIYKAIFPNELKLNSRIYICAILFTEDFVFATFGALVKSNKFKSKLFPKDKFHNI